MDNPVCYKLRAFSIATGTFVKCYTSKSFPSFKAFLELSFSRIMHAYMFKDCSRLLVTLTHATFSLAYLFVKYVIY